MTPAHILLSRTDSIGDVVLTLPMAKALKDAFPGVRISFLGKAYTRPVIEACRHIHQFVDVADWTQERAVGIPPVDTIVHVFPRPELARQAKSSGIPVRIGTTNRLYHWATCNRLVKLSRKNSDLHEAQLNMKLLAPLGIRQEYALSELGTMTGLTPQVPLPEVFAQRLQSSGPNIILHPKSQGSAREWGLEPFAELAARLHAAGCKVYISGTAADGALLQPLLNATRHVTTDITGQMDLPVFIAFMAACDGLVAASTGPLHVAAALGKATVGLYPSIRPMHAGRWAPLGPKAVALQARRCCSDCRTAPSQCHCMAEISPQQVVREIQSLL